MLKLAFIIDPIALLDPLHDTSVALMEAAQSLGHQVWITQANLLSVVDSKAWTTLEQVQLQKAEVIEGRLVVKSPWYQLGDRIFAPPRNDGCRFYAYRSSGKLALSLCYVHFGLHK